MAVGPWGAGLGAQFATLRETVFKQAVFVMFPSNETPCFAAAGAEPDGCSVAEYALSCRFRYGKAGEAGDA